VGSDLKTKNLTIMKYLSDYMQDAQTALFNELGSFFAFSMEQYNEKAKEGVKYTNMAGGLICPSENVDRMIEGLETIANKAVDQDIKENGPTAIIQREYFNHECQITSDTSDAVEALSTHIERHPEKFTPEQIKATFNKCFELAVKEDWF